MLPAGVRRWGFVPAALLALALWIVASLPADDLKHIQQAPQHPLLRTVLSDRPMHALTFGLFTLLTAWGFSAQPRAPAPRARAAVLAVGFGFLIELYQGILPWRSFGFDDLLWNTVGVLLALAALKWRQRQVTP